VLSSLLARRKSQYEAEAVIRWAHERTGRYPKVFISDSNAAFGAALENLGLGKTVTHGVVNHSQGFRNPRGYETNLMELFWGTSELYEASSFRGFRDWENTHRYCETFDVYYNFILPIAPLRSTENQSHPQAGFKYVGCWSTLIRGM
jgi:hypothetical protein